MVALLASSALQLYADEPTRRAQEELRKRNLYFGDIDGQRNPELGEALKQYQARKGFIANGKLDEETANSLKIRIAAAPQKDEQAWPDVPVLKSDAARELAEPDRAAIQPNIEHESSLAPSPPPPAEPPSKEDELRLQQMTNFVRDYLHDGESDDLDRQLRYYAFPVQYFDHGQAGRDFVVKDTRNYINRWPHRSYTLLGLVTFLPPGKSGQTQVEFTIEFKVQNEKHAVSGKTRNFWTIQPDQKNFKIIAINEQRLHD